MATDLGVSRFGRMLRRLAGALVLGLPILFATVPAHADWHGHGGWGHGGWGHGGWGHGGWGWGCCGWGWGWGWPWVGVGVYPGYGYYDPYAYYPPYYYAPPPVVVNPSPPAMQSQPNCQNGYWRHPNGTTSAGVACLQPDGTWRLVQ